MPYINLPGGKMTPEQAREVVQALQDKGFRFPCPRCGSPQFTLLDTRPPSTATLGI